MVRGDSEIVLNDEPATVSPLGFDQLERNAHVPLNSNECRIAVVAKAILRPRRANCRAE